ncbi:hypothetical protein BVSY1_17980 [Bacillus velezensis]|nr:hypothetical protein BVSY1_17980 [Bacillus velezensis]
MWDEKEYIKNKDARIRRPFSFYAPRDALSAGPAPLIMLSNGLAPRGIPIRLTSGIVKLYLLNVKQRNQRFVRCL